MKNPIVLLGLGILGVIAYYKFFRKSSETEQAQIRKNYFADVSERQQVGRVAQNQNVNAVPPLLDGSYIRAGYLALTSILNPAIDRNGENTADSLPLDAFYPDDSQFNQSLAKRGSVDFSSPLLQNVF